MTRPLAVGTDPLEPMHRSPIDDRVVVIYRLDRSGAADLGRAAGHGQDPAREPAAPRGRRRRRRGRRARPGGRGGREPASTSSCRSCPRASCSRTSPACPPSSTWPRCAMRWPPSAAIPARINPLVPADLVIDHSVQVDRVRQRRRLRLQRRRASTSATASATSSCAGRRRAFRDFRVVPPGTGIVHQVNLEYLGRRSCSRADATARRVAYPDTLVGTDSHTTMVNGARRARLGRRRHRGRGRRCSASRSTMPMPRVVGVAPVTASCRAARPPPTSSSSSPRCCAATASSARSSSSPATAWPRLTLADRATISNMSPEFGATAALFPIDDETLDLPAPDRTGEPEQVALVETYAANRGCGASRAAGRTSTSAGAATWPAWQPSRGGSAATAGSRAPARGSARPSRLRLPRARCRRSERQRARRTAEARPRDEAGH